MPITIQLLLDYSCTLYNPVNTTLLLCPLPSSNILYSSWNPGYSHQDQSEPNLCPLGKSEKQLPSTDSWPTVDHNQQLTDRLSIAY